MSTWNVLREQRDSRGWICERELLLADLSRDRAIDAAQALMQDEPEPLVAFVVESPDGMTRLDLPRR